MQRDEIDDLLPFYATGRLSEADRARVEAALARDPALRLRLDLAREEMEETVALNESLGHPSGRARDALFARIDAAGGSRASTAARAWWERLVEALTPRGLALGFAAAALLAVVQAGVLAALLARGGEADYTVATGPMAAAGGTRLLVGFTPDAPAGQIESLLQGTRAVIVDGPRTGGLYQLRIGEGPADPAARQQAIATLRSRPDLVRLAAPSP